MKKTTAHRESSAHCPLLICSATRSQHHAVIPKTGIEEVLGGVMSSIQDHPMRSNGNRRRRSAEDAAELKKQIRAARRKKVSIREIAAERDITPSYVYQMQK
jgi:hypothetical protein